MSTSTAKWREEQILIICPGSRTTMAQLGCTELTPPTHRMATRMFRDGNAWRPYYTFKRTRVVDGVETEEWVEDVDEDKGAVWPIQGGRIVCMEAFLAFLEHVHGLLTTTYHNTPIMLMASPQWTRPDCEAIAQYTFEKTRTPALCMIHSGIATQYGLKWPSMTVVDIGFEKVDVTAIHDGKVVNHTGLGSSGSERRISGGEVFTRRLVKLLEGKNFTYDMAEQLKRSAICEVLPYAPGEDDLVELPEDTTTTTTTTTTTAAAADAAKLAEVGGGGGGGDGNDGHEDDHENDDADDNHDDMTGGYVSAAVPPADDGVLDVAAIVTSGQTKEFLAKKEEEKEKEKEKKKPGRKPKAQQEAEASSARPARLPNARRKTTTFYYEEIVQEEEEEEPAAPGEAEAAAAAAAAAPDNDDDVNNDDAAAAAAAAAATTTTAAPPAEPRPKRVRRDIQVGLERFTFADRHEIDRIATAIYRTVQGIDDMYMRPPCWDNLVFVGNGSRLRGLKENIIQTLSARHLVSPSTATIFASELPSNAATPSGTGSQTPTGSFTGALPAPAPGASGVNPLLQAATAAAAAAAASSSSDNPPGGAAPAHHFHSQTPTSIKTAALPTYLGEWSKNGFEEAMFLGAQVAARIAFCLHSNMDALTVEAQRQMSLSRVDYNELGPKAIRTHSMLE